MLLIKIMLSMTTIAEQHEQKLLKLTQNGKTMSPFLYSMFICILIFLSAFAGSNVVYAQTDKVPTFQDAYWTENNNSSSTQIKKEVGPGEGAAILAVVLVNKARSDITGVTAYLSLPSNFRAATAIDGEGVGIDNNNNNSSVARASFNSIVKSGHSFTLYFDVYILKDAKVGSYSASLKLVYSKILEVGDIVATIPTTFRLPGKVILDTAVQKQYLIPGRPNELTILVNNRGSVNATSVIATITDVGDTSTSSTTNSNNNTTTSDPNQSISSVNVGSTTFDIGTIPVNGSTEINSIIYPSYSASESAQELALQISYGDSYGKTETLNSVVGFVVSPNPPESVLRATLITIDNGGGGGGKNSTVLTSGKIEDLNLIVTNNGKRPVYDVVLTLDSVSESVQILGGSKWTLSNIASESKANFSTTVFASEDMIGQSVPFDLKAQYISGNGQSKTDTINLAAYVEGEIKIRAYELAINYIGGDPNLVGNLLNEGNTDALFTTIQMVKPNSSQQLGQELVSVIPEQQYLGDVAENSPVPFSIPLSIDSKNTKAGTYPVTLKITYKDNLRTMHELNLNGTVKFEPRQTQTSNEEQGFLGFGGSQRSGEEGISANIINQFTIALTIIVIVIIGLAFVAIRKRRLKSTIFRLGKRQKNESFFLDNS